MTFSRLTLGEPRLKSNLRGGSVETADPCNEPQEYGANIHPDPGLESYLATSNGAGSGDEIPAYFVNGAPDDELRWYDFSDATFAYWMQDFNRINGFGERRYKLSTTNPRSGTYHVRSAGVLPDAAGSDSLYPVKFEWCDSPAYPWAWSAVVVPGDFVQATCFARASTITGQPLWVIDLENYDSSGSFLSTTKTEVAMTTSYASYSADEVVPSGTTYLLVRLSARATDHLNIPADFHMDIDDVAIEVQP